jgi:hypothetical protein
MDLSRGQGRKPRSASNENEGGRLENHQEELPKGFGEMIESGAIDGDQMNAARPRKISRSLAA